MPKKISLLFFALTAALVCCAYEIRVVPGFNTCSYYIKSSKSDLKSVEYGRRNSDTRHPALPPIYDAKVKEYRGSIVHLKENTAYRITVTGNDGRVKTKEFRTRRSKLPVAKTIVLDEKNFTGNLKISSQGSKNGYIRYTCAPGFVLKNDGKTPLIELQNARCIILENLTMQGGHRNAVVVHNSRDILISNCDISGWGRKGVQRFDLDGKFYSDYGPKKINKECFNYDAAVDIKWSNTVTVEKCYIHDPVSHANSWFYSHPTGPAGLTVSKSRKVVIRYNDIVGSDLHRWNDAVEGPGNFIPNGGIGFDGDVYGNYMAFSNDDGIELDGGQANVRCFHNKFEQTFCGVSVQGCMTGPGYVFENVLTYITDGEGCGNQAFKTNSDRAGKYAVSYIFNNSVYTPNETELKLQPAWPVIAKNNIHCGMSTLARMPNHKGSSECNTFTVKTEVPGKGDVFNDKNVFADNFDGQLFLAENSSAKASGCVIPGFTGSKNVDRGARPDGKRRMFPVRPLPFNVSTSELNFKDLNSNQTVTMAVDKKAAPVKFNIRINSAIKWLKVTPASGTVKPGEKLTFTVSIDKAEAKKFRFLRGAFLIRTPSGLSRPVSVYAVGIPENITRPQVADGKFVSFIEPDVPNSGATFAKVKDELADNKLCLDFSTQKDDNGKYIIKPAVYHFEVPEDGFYNILFRVKAIFPRKTHDSIFAAVDGDPLRNCSLMTVIDGKWKYQMLKRPGQLPLGFMLKKGKHTLTLAPREATYLDLIAVTNDPAVFEVW